MFFDLALSFAEIMQLFVLLKHVAQCRMHHLFSSVRLLHFHVLCKANCDFV